MLIHTGGVEQKIVVALLYINTAKTLRAPGITGMQPGAQRQLATQHINPLVTLADDTVLFVIAMLRLRQRLQFKQSTDMTALYRDLRNRITDLVELVVGTEAEQD